MNVEQLKEELEEWPNDLPIFIEVKGVEAPATQLDYVVQLDNSSKRLILHDYPTGD